MRLDAGKALVEQRFHDDRQRGLGGRRARHQQDGKHQALPVGAHALVDPPPEFGFDRLGAQGRFACGRIQRNHSLQYNYAVDCTGCAPPSAPVPSLTCAPAPAHVRIQLSVCPPAQLGWRCLHEPAQPARPAGGRPALVICARPWARDLLEGIDKQDFIAMRGKVGPDRAAVSAHRRALGADGRRARGLLLPDSLSSALVFRLAGLPSAGYRDDGRSLLRAGRWTSRTHPCTPSNPGTT